MKQLLAIAALVLIASPARATTVADYDSKPVTERGACVASFIDKMTTDIRIKNPELATNIRNWFTVKQEGKPLSEGMERLTVELGALELQAKAGKADLGQIEVENVIVYLVKQKFSPPAR